MNRGSERGMEQWTSFKNPPGGRRRESDANSDELTTSPISEEEARIRVVKVKFKTTGEPATITLKDGEKLPPEFILF